MFTRILEWIKEWVRKMLGQTTVKEALHIDIAMSSEMANALQTWALMYQNQADWLTTDIVSTGLPAAIAGEIARATTIEMSMEVTGSPRAKFLQEQMSDVIDQMRKNIEYGCAKGGLVIKPYVTGKTIAVDYVQADQFYPVSFDSAGRITAIVFSDQRTVGDKYYTRLEYHRVVPEGCRITNAAFRSDTKSQLGTQVPLSSLEDWKDLQDEALITDVTRPLFGYFKYPLANNVDPTSPLGVSCYSRAVELIKQADGLWSNLIWEFESGKRAIYVDSTAFDKGSDGKPKLSDKRLYRDIGSGADLGVRTQLFDEWSPEFREESIKSGLDAILKRIEFTCGLAYGTLSDPQTVDKTATEIKISNQRTFSTITDTQKSVRVGLDQLLYAMDMWAKIYKLAPAGAYKSVYNFDDSIVSDADARFSHDSQALGLRVMGRVEFRMRNYGETEAIARQRIADIDAEAAAVDENELM